jgi:hypothetical protein
MFLPLQHRNRQLRQLNRRREILRLEEHRLPIHLGKDGVLANESSYPQLFFQVPIKSENKVAFYFCVAIKKAINKIQAGGGIEITGHL